MKLQLLVNLSISAIASLTLSLSFINPANSLQTSDLMTKNPILAQNSEVATEDYATIEKIIRTYGEQKQYQQALSYIGNLKDRDIKDSSYKTLADLALAAQQGAIVEQCLEGMENLSLKLALIQQLTEAYVSQGQLEAAAVWVNRGFELDQAQETFEAANWAKYFLLTGQEDKVTQMLVGRSGDNYEDAYARYLIASAYLQLGNLEKAWELTKSVPSNVILPLPEYRDPRDENLDSILQQSLAKNSYDFAIMVALTYHQAPDQVNALRTIAQQQISQNQTQEAEKVLEQAVAIAKTIERINIVPERHFSWIEPNAGLLTFLAEDYLKIGQKTEALNLLSLAATSATNFADQINFDMPVWTRTQTHLALAIKYQELGEIEECQKLLELATTEAQELKAYPRYVIESLIAIANVYRAIEQPQLAASIQNQAVTIAETIADEAEKQELLGKIKGN